MHFFNLQVKFPGIFVVTTIGFVVLSLPQISNKLNSKCNLDVLTVSQFFDLLLLGDLLGLMCDCTDLVSLLCFIVFIGSSCYFMTTP